MTRVAALVYGVAVYFLFFATFLYLIGFVADAPFLPFTINRGGVLGGGTGAAIIIDLGLIALFGVQHSVMARKDFKKAWTRVIHGSLERSTYVLLTSLILILIYWLWQPIPASVWSVESAAGQYVLWGLCALGWATVLISTFVINHFDLFGLRQVWHHFRQKHETPIPFKATGLYRFVRHPIYFGFILAFWATPDMTLGHLLFALAMSLYILIGIVYEERDLHHHFGEKYRDYARRVPMLFPFLHR